MGIAVYLNFFVLVTQLFLKVPALHALRRTRRTIPTLCRAGDRAAIFIWLHRDFLGDLPCRGLA